MDAVEAILDFFERSGGGLYLGEQVTQLQHALQAAQLAARDGAAEALIGAALLHDIGHLMAGGEEDHPAADLRHEELGASWLRERFPEEVWQPVRLHVAAKRYLCATDPGYRERLSAASLHSLRLQGGPMKGEEIREFEASPFRQAAVQLRLWDEAAKDAAADPPGISTYRELLTRLLSENRTPHRG